MKLFVLLKEIDGVPTEFQVLPYGEIEINGRDKPAILDDVAMKEIIAQFQSRGNDMVIDYEHQTLEGTQAPAAGWIRRLVDKGREGLWAVVEWTERAKEYLKNKEYRYFSPVMWIHDKSNRVVLIENIGLTNYPRINNLKPIMAKMELARPDLSSRDHNTEDKQMEKIKQILKLPADAAADKVEEGVEQIIAKCADLETKLADAETKAADAAKVVACKEVITALGADEKASAEDVVKIITGMRALETPATKLAQEVQVLKTKLADREQQDLVQEALKTGRTSPAELEAWGNDLAKASPEQFRKIVLSRQPGSVVPLEKINLGKDTLGSGLADANQKEINKMMGISDETFAKFSPKPAE